MLDFVVNLLIFFIVSAVFVKESGVVVNRPTDRNENTGERSSSIQILDDGGIWLDGRRVDPRAVRANIERLRAAKPKAGVIVIAEGASPTGTLVDVVDQVRLGGIYDITFAAAR